MPARTRGALSGDVIAPDDNASSPLPAAEAEQLRRDSAALTLKVQLLEFEVRRLKHDLWGRKSERFVPGEDRQEKFFEDLPAPVAPTPPLPAPKPAVGLKPARKIAMGPKPVATDWPAGVLPRARMHASVLAHLATAHFADPLPYYRIEQQLGRVGVDLPRNCQVSPMAQLDKLVEPLVRTMRDDVLGSGYVGLDASPIPLLDPARPGAAPSDSTRGLSRNTSIWLSTHCFATAGLDTQSFASRPRLRVPSDCSAKYSGCFSR